VGRNELRGDPVGTAGASSETATPGLEPPTETGSEVFDAAFSGFGSGDAPAGSEAALGLLEEAQSPDAQTGLEIAQTPATETATAAGLSLGQDLSPGATQAPATDAEAAADTAGQQALVAEQTAQSRGLAAPAQATANPAETSPGFPDQPAYPNEPGFGEEVVAQPVEQGPPRRPPRDDDDDDDEVVGLFGAGEAATPFANPVVGGPEAFGVAGGSLVSTDDDDDSPGLGLGVP